MAFKMSSSTSHTWTLEQRHFLHIIATHYPESTWTQRGKIFNSVFSTNFANSDKIRDEYGGHKSGKRVEGSKPTRSTKWNDEVCRDEFRIPGGFNQQQVADRRAMLQRIQGAITALGMSREGGLMALNVVVGMIRADNNVVSLPPPAPPVATPAPAPAVSTSSASSSTPAAQATTSSTTAVGLSTNSNSSTTAAAQGNRPFYHSRELRKSTTTTDHFVYTSVLGLSYSVIPTKTYKRYVEFPSNLTKQVEVCALEACGVCKNRA
jgi:hypothetical protein